MTPSDLRNLWNEQFKLNELFRPEGPPTEYAERTALTKEMILHMFSEADELLRVSGSWKPHRRQEVRENRPAIAFELADMLKYWITICQIWGLSPEDMIEYSRKKTMIVRQRHSEEFLKEINRPSVLVDLDGVLADYMQGFLLFMVNEGAISIQTFNDLYGRRAWVGQQTLEPYMTEVEYGALRHKFRASGGFARLPMLAGARSLMDWLHEEGYYIIILTSRPITLYPNIYSDTITWLDARELKYDFIWWGNDKGQLIEEKDIRRYVSFAIDDDWKFVQQLAGLNIDTYWVSRDGKAKTLDTDYVTVVSNLTELLALQTR